jgi:hypothetical protein
VELVGAIAHAAQRHAVELGQGHQDAAATVQIAGLGGCETCGKFRQMAPIGTAPDGDRFGQFRFVADTTYDEGQGL